MCGICGIIRYDGQTVESSEVKRMCQTLLHRGPDDEGIHVGGGIGLGQRRLSIIDLRPCATAPLTNEDGSLWIVFNGEIYNFRDLRNELEQKGHRFRTNTDTEVILHLYEDCGTECLRQMRGMFAFALWDGRRKILFAARDRFGKKPFVYCHSATSFVFGSEIKAILAVKSISKAPNFAAIDSYLTLQYVPSPLTAFVGISKLPPAHYLLLESSGALQVERYWTPPIGHKLSLSPPEIEEELRRRLREAVRLRLMADVPLGALLSGGIDSGAVVALMAEQSLKPVKTFTIGFEEEDYNELPYARLVANRYGTDHHELIVKPKVSEIIPLLVEHYNEPFADSSAIPTYYVSQMTRRHVTVALSGDGGDESFAGYENYRRTLHWQRLDAIPFFLRAPVARLLVAACARLPYHYQLARLENGARMMTGNLPARFQLLSSVFKEREKQQIYSPRFLSLLAAQEAKHPPLIPNGHAQNDALSWMMWHDQQCYLPDCLMVKSDIASMANSLELRCPFLDHLLAEFAASIPSHWKGTATEGKSILKKAMASLLPPEVLAKRKTGFGIPLGRWLRGELYQLLTETLLSDRACRRGLFQRPFLEQMIHQHREGTRDWGTRLWALLFLELWFQRFFD